MNSQSLAFNGRIGFIILPLLLLFGLLTVGSMVEPVINNSGFWVGAFCDVAFVLPFLYAWSIRSTSIPKITILSFVVLGVFSLGWVIPAHMEPFYLEGRMWVLMVVELGVFLYLFGMVYRLKKELEFNRQEHSDVLTLLRKSAVRIFQNSKVAAVFAYESAMCYYALLAWNFGKTPKGNAYFSYTKNNGNVALYIVLIFLIFIETVALDLLLMRWSVVAATILFYLSLYSAIQLLGHLKAMILRPVLYKEGVLYLRYGLMGGANIASDNIKNIELIHAFRPAENIKHLALLGELEKPNIYIQFKCPQQIEGFYGWSKAYEGVFCYIDNPQRFLDFLQKNDK